MYHPTRMMCATCKFTQWLKMAHIVLIVGRKQSCHKTYVVFRNNSSWTRVHSDSRHARLAPLTTVPGVLECSCGRIHIGPTSFWQRQQGYNVVFVICSLCLRYCDTRDQLGTVPYQAYQSFTFGSVTSFGRIRVGNITANVQNTTQIDCC